MELFVLNNGDKPLIKRGEVNPKRPWWDIALEQFVNSIIVGLMAFVATVIAGEWNVSWKAGLIAMGIAWLSEMRKYWPRK